MDLRSDNPYWLLRSGLVNTYASLQQPASADVAIMGAGITGALVAWHLCKAGFSVVVVDKRHAAMGSTSASTALLQYEIDTPLRELKELVGERNAVRSYEMCRQSIYDLQQICGQLKTNTEFDLRPSFQYASLKKDVKDLRKEYELRRQNGFEIDWLEQGDIKAKFGLEAPAGVLSKDGAQVNAYLLTHALLQDISKQNVWIYDNTKVEKIVHGKNKVVLKTSTGYDITAKKLVIACGYESQNYIPKKVEDLYGTYAIVSEPFTKSTFWYKDALIWETARPYLYLRSTTDNRILIGGLDEDYTSAKKRDELLAAKARLLEKKFCKLFPDITFRTDFKWAGTFSGTKDGLPYIGSIPQRKHTYFALGFGGNGITFSLMAAQLLTEMLSGKSPKDAGIFSFNR